jgi:hypothetical protein
MRKSIFLKKEIFQNRLNKIKNKKEFNKEDNKEFNKEVNKEEKKEIINKNEEIYKNKKEDIKKEDNKNINEIKLDGGSKEWKELNDILNEEIFDIIINEFKFNFMTPVQGKKKINNKFRTYNTIIIKL